MTSEGDSWRPTVSRIGLKGWSARSVFGWDEGVGCWWAQLWRDQSAANEPDVWIADAGGAVTGLVRLVAEGTQEPVDAVDGALEGGIG